MSIKVFKVKNNKIGYYLSYHPYKKGKNPKFDDASRLILDVKEYNKDSHLQKLFSLLRENGLDDLINEIKSKFNTLTICTVPPHKVAKQISSTQKLAKLIARYYNIKDGTDYLIRHKDIEKLALGNDRSKNIHYNSIRIKDKVDVKNKTILLIDDIVTTGNSLIACSDILKNEGAKKVILFAIYKTTN